MTSLFGSKYSEIDRAFAYDPGGNDSIPEGFKLDLRVRDGLIGDFMKLWAQTKPIPNFTERRTN
jgi:hypothetical protein